MQLVLFPSPCPSRFPSVPQSFFSGSQFSILNCLAARSLATHSPVRQFANPIGAVLAPSTSAGSPSVPSPSFSISGQLAQSLEVRDLPAGLMIPIFTLDLRIIFHKCDLQRKLI